MRLSESEHARLMVLAETASYRIDELLSNLDVNCRFVGKMYVGACPVHGGDRTNAFNLYPDGHTVRGLWACRTRQCQKVFQRTIPGLVRGILSHRETGWCNPGDKMVTMAQVRNYLCEFIGQKWSELKADLVAVEKHRFVSNMATLGYFPEVKPDGWDLKEVKKRLVIPSRYYLARGYSEGVLREFSVGDALTKDVNSPMFERAVMPVMDPDGRVVVGVTGRSLHDKCPTCKLYHGAACPSLNYRQDARYYKWRNSSFNKADYLYGWAHIKDEVKRTGKLLLTEGPGDALRAREAGCRVATAMFGVELTDPQMVLMEASGATDVYVASDNDEAGREAAKHLLGQLRRAFRVKVIHPPNKDLGETPVSEAVQWLHSYQLA